MSSFKAEDFRSLIDKLTAVEMRSFGNQPLIEKGWSPFRRNSSPLADTNIAEAGWWPSKKDTSPAPYSHMKGAVTNRPPAARPAGNVSEAVIDLKQAANELQIRPNDEIALTHCETLTQGLLNQAGAAGMDQFVPILQRILHFLSLGQSQDATRLYSQFFTGFEQLMQSGAY